MSLLKKGFTQNSLRRFFILDKLLFMRCIKNYVITAIKVLTILNIFKK